MKHRGGKRKGAGRKPIKDKKIAVTIYVRPSEIERLGGIVAFKKSLKD